MDINSKKVKEIMKSLGADLCGIASIERFSEAPEGYHPRDVMPQCKSICVCDYTHIFVLKCHFYFLLGCGD